MLLLFLFTTVYTFSASRQEPKSTNPQSAGSVGAPIALEVCFVRISAHGFRFMIRVAYPFPTRTEPTILCQYNGCLAAAAHPFTTAKKLYRQRGKGSGV